MTVAQLIFYFIAAGTVLGGLGVVLIRSTVYAALFLILSLLSVAGLYILLASEFLALVQVLIYGGAVTVLLLATSGAGLLLASYIVYASARVQPRAIRIIPRSAFI